MVLANDGSVKCGRCGVNPGLTQEIDKVIEQYGQAHDELEAVWGDKIVFTWHWWLDVALAVLPWVIWFIVRDRRNSTACFMPACSRC
ncbi:MAG: hypothetical protein GX936_05740 [Clostridiales bacterium]|jgi:hypothetical protein|nr:hypothetical protein [Clostridiales bacterium]